MDWLGWLSLVILSVLALFVAWKADAYRAELKTCQMREEIVCPLPTSCIIERQDKHTYVLRVVDCAECAERVE